MSNLVQFISNQVLFRGGTICFSATSSPCPCVPPTELPPPDPDTHTCKACESAAPSSFLSCTPQRIQLTFTEPTYQPSCLACSGDGKSVKVVSGTLAGDKVLEQDPYNSNRWLFTDNSPSVVVGGFDSGDCTSTETDANRLEYSLRQDVDSFTIQIVARLEQIKGAEFVLFSTTVTGKFPDSLAIALAGDSGFPFECLDYTERGGGRLGQGGSVTISLCPDIPEICHCTDSPTCISIESLTIPPDLADFTYDDTATAKITIPRTDVCEWFTGTISGAGVSNLQVKVKWYNDGDTQAERGCGYYLYLYAFDGVDPLLKGVYFHYGEDAGGVYELYDELVTGLPRSLIVDLSCPPVHDCGDTTGWPSQMVVNIVSDPEHTDPYNIEGEWTLDWDGSSSWYLDLPGGSSVRLALLCVSTGWELQVQLGIDRDYYEAPKHGGGPYTGSYYWIGGDGHYDQLTLNVQNG